MTSPPRRLTVQAGPPAELPDDEGGCLMPDIHVGQPVIEVSGLGKRYGNKQVLRGVDFSVHQGEVFCLLGPNGVGKTTTIEVLEGFRAATAGTVRVLGFDPSVQELRERTGVVLQECGFPTHMKVGEILRAWRELATRSKATTPISFVAPAELRRGDVMLPDRLRLAAASRPGALAHADARVEITSGDPWTDLRVLLDWAERNRLGQLADLLVAPPSPGDAYLYPFGPGALANATGPKRPDDPEAP